MMATILDRLNAHRRIVNSDHGDHMAVIDGIIADYAARPPITADPLRAISYTLPVANPVSQWYIAQGHTFSSVNPGGHTGLDINLITGGDTDLGQPVYSTCNGLAVYAQQAPGAYWGNIVIVQAIGARGIEFWRYAHLDRIDAQVGDYIFANDSVGTIGKGGQNRYWAHLHLDLWRGEIQTPTAYRNRGGGWVDPLTVWSEAGYDWEWGTR